MFSDYFDCIPLDLRNSMPVITTDTLDYLGPPWVQYLDSPCLMQMKLLTRLILYKI